MAALNDADLSKILGANFLSQLEASNLASGVKARERMKLAQISGLDGNRSLGVYAALLGAILIVASLLSVSGMTLAIQIASGGAILALGSVTFAYFNMRVLYEKGELVAIRAEPHT